MSDINTSPYYAPNGAGISIYTYYLQQISSILGDKHVQAPSSASGICFNDEIPPSMRFTLPEANSSHLKMDGWNTRLVSFWVSAYFQVLLLMEEILHQLIGRLSHYLQSFIHSRWCRISSINSMLFLGSVTKTKHYPQLQLNDWEALAFSIALIMSPSPSCQRGFNYVFFPQIIIYTSDTWHRYSKMMAIKMYLLSNIAI